MSIKYIRSARHFRTSVLQQNTCQAQLRFSLADDRRWTLAPPPMVDRLSSISGANEAMAATGQWGTFLEARHDATLRRAPAAQPRASDRCGPRRRTDRPAAPESSGSVA